MSSPSPRLTLRLHAQTVALNYVPDASPSPTMVKNAPPPVLTLVTEPSPISGKDFTQRNALVALCESKEREGALKCVVQVAKPNFVGDVEVFFISLQWVIWEATRLVDAGHTCVFVLALLRPL